MNENDIFKALADPTRRAIFDKLTAGSLNASALRDGMPITQSAMSQHLAVLRKACLIREQRLPNHLLADAEPLGAIPDKEVR